MSNLVDQVGAAMKATKLDGARWDLNYLRELARAAIKTVRAQDLANTEPAPTDQQTSEHSEKLHDPPSRPGVWALF
jgi:hypothetical protein